MIFVSDTFTGVDGTDLTAHTGETGATWTEHPNFTSGAWKIQANRAYSDNVNSSMDYASGVPNTAEYDVEGVMYVASDLSGQALGIVGRMDTVATTYYYASYSGTTDTWTLFEVVAGTPTSLGTHVQTLSAATSYTVKLELRDHAKKLYVDGVERIASSANVITGAGRVGLRRTGTASATTTGFHFDSLTATNAPASSLASLGVG